MTEPDEHDTETSTVLNICDCFCHICETDRDECCQDKAEN